MKHKGFTIVELIIVIAVIAILATLSMQSYGTWRDRAAKTEVMSDLRNAALAMKNYRNFNSQTPATLAAVGFKESPNVTVSMPVNSNAGYCIQAFSKIKTSITYYINSTTNKDPTTGTCPPVSTPNIPSVPPGNIGYLPFTDCIYVTIDPPTGVAVSSYSYFYRNNSTAEWMPSSDSTGSFCSDSIVASYLNYGATGSLRIVANSASGTTSPPLDLPYSFIEEWE